MLQTVALDHLRLIAITGADRQAFLQGQLTQDVRSAGPAATVLAGWADAKGRLQFAGHLFPWQAGAGEALALLVPAELAEALVRRLRLYVLRARVQVDVPELRLTGVVVTGPDEVPAGALRLAGAPARFLLAGAAVGGAEAGTIDDWRLADIRDGLPAVLAATAGEFVPHTLNLDLLGAISFTKGCYTGQEIVARMKYLGRVKRRMFRFGAATPPPVPGATLAGSRGVAGQVVSSAATPGGCEFLAAVVLDELAGPLFLDGDAQVPVDRLGLPYAVPGNDAG